MNTKRMTVQEHTTSLFVIALYYWFDDDQEAAQDVLDIAVRVMEIGTVHHA